MTELAFTKAFSLYINDKLDLEGYTELQFPVVGSPNLSLTVEGSDKVYKGEYIEKSQSVFKPSISRLDDFPVVSFRIDSSYKSISLPSVSRCYQEIGNVDVKIVYKSNRKELLQLEFRDTPERFGIEGHDILEDFPKAEYVEVHLNTNITENQLNVLRLTNVTGLSCDAETVDIKTLPTLHDLKRITITSNSITESFITNLMCYLSIDEHETIKEVNLLTNIGNFDNLKLFLLVKTLLDKQYKVRVMILDFNITITFEVIDEVSTVTINPGEKKFKFIEKIINFVENIGISIDEYVLEVTLEQVPNAWLALYRSNAKTYQVYLAFSLVNNYEQFSKIVLNGGYSDKVTINILRSTAKSARSC